MDETKDPKKLDRIISMITSELDFATTKFGTFHNTHEGYGVMKEEFDEMWDRIKQNSNLCFEECIQLAAMAIRFIYDLSDEQILRAADSSIRDRLWVVKHGKQALENLRKADKEKEK